MGRGHIVAASRTAWFFYVYIRASRHSRATRSALLSYDVKGDVRIRWHVAVKATDDEIATIAVVLR